MQEEPKKLYSFRDYVAWSILCAFSLLGVFGVYVQAGFFPAAGLGLSFICLGVFGLLGFTKGRKAVVDLPPTASSNAKAGAFIQAIGGIKIMVFFYALIIVFGVGGAILGSI